MLLTDAEEAARIVFGELRITGRFLFTEVWNLCLEHGCEPLVTPLLSRRAGGLFADFNHDLTQFSDGGYIVLADSLTFRESCAVMIHELAHRIAYTPRMAQWALEGGRRFRAYEPNDWQEAFACALERLFLEAGGTGLLPPRY